MSHSKMGKVFPEMGKVFPETDLAERYAVVIAAALRDELGDTHHALKTVIRWTGASERTVKNWFAGTSGPSGAHLIALARNSDEVFEAFLLLSRRGSARTTETKSLVSLRNSLRDALQIAEMMCHDR